MGKTGLENREDILKNTSTFLDYQDLIAKNGKDSYYHQYSSNAEIL